MPIEAHPITGPKRRRWLRRVVGLVVGAIVLIAALVGVLWFNPPWFMRLGHAAAYWRYGVAERSTTVDGHAWPWLESGPAGAPPVLLLHGYGTSKDAMMMISSWLAPAHRVVAPDLPGFGTHDFHEGEVHDGAFYARSVLRFMDAIGIERASIVGTSMGGAIAAEIALTQPDRVDRLVLLAPAGLVAPVVNDFMRRADAGDNPLRMESDEDFNRVVALVFEEPPPIPYPVRAHLVSEAQRRLPWTNQIIPAIESFGRRGLEGRLGEIRAPTLVLWGDRDRVLDRSLLARFVAEIPGAKGEEVAGAGHVLFSDRPDEVRRRIVPFLAPVVGARDAVPTSSRATASSP